MRLAAWIVGCAFLVVAAQGVSAAQESTANAGASTGPRTGNVIFFHPDGSSSTHWAAARILRHGPDGALHWDRLPALGVYAGHTSDSLTSSSHGGATIHAYGVKVVRDSFGQNGTEPVIAASGKPMSIMEEALAAGKSVGLIQSGHLAEPGTAGFLASVDARAMRDEIAAQLMTSGAQVLLAGGERYLRPAGADGVHGPGERDDGRDLIAEARAAGYTVAFRLEELEALDLTEVDKLLGVFAWADTYNAASEEDNAESGLPAYDPDAPTLAAMAEAALTILSRNPNGFLLVAEEEGTDNLGNSNNASGTLEALLRADDAVGVFSQFVDTHPDTLLIMAADSNAGGMTLVGPSAAEITRLIPDGVLPPRMRNGAPLDGVAGAGTAPFVSGPDIHGVTHRFGISWSGFSDVSGGVLVRAKGMNADKVEPLLQNTTLYDLMYVTLFGMPPEEAAER